ncbi:MAG: RtcB family protein [Desulfobacterales bacterium]|nr:RtcB family protein [Desulfobacterales bacterium]
MHWEKFESNFKVPIKSWCNDIEDGAMQQAINLSKHPVVFHHVALMPDCHEGYGMPIGGVMACSNAVIPNAVGVDIGCGMGAVQTDFPEDSLQKDMIRRILNHLKKLIPVGEGHSHRSDQSWDGFEEYMDKYGDIDKSKLAPSWYSKKVWDLAKKNLGSLGGGNHFIEIQAGNDGFVWLMIHSGSRNLGYIIANHYNETAKKLNQKSNISLPSKDLAFLSADSEEGVSYIRDMNFALNYAKENRRHIMENFKTAFYNEISCNFVKEINIHHNYAALENHFGRNIWLHRKGATSAKKGELGIIPGSMGTPSYIVEGLGNTESFMSCSHGSGRVMGRMDASRRLSKEECDKSMSGIVFDGWGKFKGFGKKKHKGGSLDLSEAPQAYKNIENVIQSEIDLIHPLVKLKPLGVVKG